MTKTYVAVDSWTAEQLTAEASRRSKTAYAFANELLDASLKLCAQGGIPRWARPVCCRSSRNGSSTCGASRAMTCAARSSACAWRRT